jgi:hypothetical protein
VRKPGRGNRGTSTFTLYEGNGGVVMGEGRVHDGVERMNENVVPLSSITMGRSSINPPSPS